MQRMAGGNVDKQIRDHVARLVVYQVEWTFQIQLRGDVQWRNIRNGQVFGLTRRKAAAVL